MALTERSGALRGSPVASSWAGGARPEAITERRAGERSWQRGGGGGGGGGGLVDNLAAGAFFGYFGRDQPARPTVIPNHTTRTMQGGGIPTVARAPHQGDDEMSDSSETSDPSDERNQTLCRSQKSKRLKYHFQIPIPIPPKFNQKNLKYRYHTGKMRTLSVHLHAALHSCTEHRVAWLP
jgi:hypothetical protein